MNCLKIFFCLGIIIFSCQTGNANQTTDDARVQLETDYRSGKISRADYEQAKRIFEAPEKALGNFDMTKSGYQAVAGTDPDGSFTAAMNACQSLEGNQAAHSKCIQDHINQP